MNWCRQITFNLNDNTINQTVHIGCKMTDLTQFGGGNQ